MPQMRTLRSRANIIAIPTHVGVEDDRNGDTRLRSLRLRGVRAEQAARGESKRAKQGAD